MNTSPALRQNGEQCKSIAGPPGVEGGVLEAVAHPRAPVYLLVLQVTCVPWTLLDRPSPAVELPSSRVEGTCAEVCQSPPRLTTRRQGFVRWVGGGVRCVCWLRRSGGVMRCAPLVVSWWASRTPSRPSMAASRTGTTSAGWRARRRRWGGRVGERADGVNVEVELDEAVALRQTSG